MGTYFRCASLALLLIVFGVPVAASSEETVRPDAATQAARGPSLAPVYRIPLRVHLGKSGRKPRDFGAIFDEINEIWLMQTGICFEIETTDTDQAAETGMDLWFIPVLPVSP